MIRTTALSADGHHQLGNEELAKKLANEPDSRLWIDVEGEITDDIWDFLLCLHCDELAIRDCQRKRHPPKVEAFDASTFILFRGISQLGPDLELEPQQIGLWVNDRMLITAHRGRSVSIEHFWQDDSPEQLLQQPHALAFRLLHYASGRYLSVLLEFEDHLGDLEDNLLTGDSEIAMVELVAYRSRLRKLRRIFSYHLRLAEQILSEDSFHFDVADEGMPHLRRDLYDRCERLHSLCNLYYEQCGDLVEGYLSLSSHQLNNTMKVLTIITAIFVPLSFLAGLYGMNFEFMPELHFKYAYFFVLGTMALVATSMLVLFKRMKWL